MFGCIYLVVILIYVYFLPSFLLLLLFLLFSSPSSSSSFSSTNSSFSSFNFASSNPASSFLSPSSSQSSSNYSKWIALKNWKDLPLFNIKSSIKISIHFSSSKILFPLDWFRREVGYVNLWFVRISHVLSNFSAFLWHELPNRTTRDRPESYILCPNIVSQNVYHNLFRGKMITIF